MPARPAAILFDLDDTILRCETGDFLILWMQCVETHIECFPGTEPDELFREIRVEADLFWSSATRHREGRLNIREARRRIVTAAAKKLGHANESDAVALADLYHDRREGNVVPFRGALEALKQVRERSIKMALVTNGSGEVQRSKINKYELADYFDTIVIEGEFGKGKPHPAVYEHVVTTLGVLATQCWMVGDNLKWEVEAPQELGIFAIWNDHKKAGLPANSTISPDHIVHSIAEIPDLLDQA